MEEVFGVRCETSVQKMGQELALRMDGMFPYYRDVLVQSHTDHPAGIHQTIATLNNSGFGADIRARYDIWSWTDEAHFISQLAIANLAHRII